MTTAASSETPAAIAARVSCEKPSFHLADRNSDTFTVGDEVVWNALPETLSFIASQIKAGSRTLETGAGASTVVFAATGAEHTAISPVEHEHERIAEYCTSIGVRTDRLSFVAASSDAVLPELDEPFDAVLLDGTHAFPYAIVEWHFLRHLLRPGGLFLVDDIPIPAVNPLFEFMHSDEHWELITHLDRRTAAFRKLRDLPEQTWRDQRYNDSYPIHSHLSLSARTAARAQGSARALRQAAGRRLPALRRRRSSG